MKVKISESAYNDLACGFKFYESQDVGLGDYFQDSLFAEFEAIEKGEWKNRG